MNPIHEHAFGAIRSENKRARKVVDATNRALSRPNEEVHLMRDDTRPPIAARNFARCC